MPFADFVEALFASAEGAGLADEAVYLPVSGQPYALAVIPPDFDDETGTFRAPRNGIVIHARRADLLSAVDPAGDRFEVYGTLYTVRRVDPVEAEADIVAIQGEHIRRR